MLETVSSLVGNYFDRFSNKISSQDFGLGEATTLFLGHKVLKML